MCGSHSYSGNDSNNNGSTIKIVSIQRYSNYDSHKEE